MNNGYYLAVKKIADRGLRKQIVNPGDYYDDKNLLVCGICNEHRQGYQVVSNPTPDDPEATVMMKVVCSCKCEREVEIEKEKAKKEEQDAHYVSLLRKTSMLGPRYENASFENFQVTKYNERNFKLCKKYAFYFKEMMKKNQGLLFWGDNGTGKTFAAACIANHLIDRKMPVFMVSLAKTMELTNDGLEELAQKVSKAPLVIFDDLGAERDTPFAQEKVYNIINTRYMSSLPMIFTTNLSLSEMNEEYDPSRKRIYDRVLEICSYPMQFTGTSFRRNIAYNRYNEMEKFFSDVE